MKINYITAGRYNYNYNPKTDKLQKTNNNTDSSTQTAPIYPLNAAYISFKAKNKKIDPETETKKLLKQFDAILESDMDTEALMRLYERQIMSQMEQKRRKADELLQSAENLANNTYLTDRQKAERLLSLKKEFNTIQKNLFKFQPFVVPKPVAPELDNALISRFKTAVQEENYNLDKVSKDYYSDLNNIQTIKELNQKYPKLKTPPEPAFVIAERIENLLTRDFYEKLDDLMHKQDKEAIYELITGKIKELIAESAKADAKKIYALTVIPASETILKKYEKLRDTNTFSSVPPFRKNRSLKISDTDVKLLVIDFDKFVLSVLKEQYLNNKKPNEITCTIDNITIPAAALKDTPYKFEKTSEKINAMIAAAKQIQTATRDYDNFDEAALRERLNKHAGSEAGNNEDIFEHIIAFDSCNFGEQDKKYLIKFLRLLDSLQDKEITEAETVDILKKEAIRPLETEKLNELEKQKVVDALKLRQKQALELNFVKSEFDNAMNVLYQNDLSGIAALCAKYRPLTIEDGAIQNAKFITNLVLNRENTDFTNVKYIIKNWDTYNYYKDNEPDSSLLAAARQYATCADGSIDVNKAGIYLNCAEIVLNPEQTLEYLPDKDIVSAVITKAGTQEKAMEYLCKYEEYKQLPAAQKTHLLSFIDNFNQKDNVEKFILKNIIENEYTKTDTISQANVNDNDTVDVTITAGAKQQLLDKYMFPGCVDFMCDFEKAMTTFATEWGTSGIKRTTKNNKAMEYKMEIKLANHDDRLFALQKDYCFDVFSDKGLH